MGGIQSASFHLFWPSIAWFIMAHESLSYGGVVEHYFPIDLAKIIYFVALVLLLAHFIIMIIKIVMTGKSFFTELKEPKNYMEMFLFLIGIHCMVGNGTIPFSSNMCSEYKVYHAIHGIVYYLAIAFGLYLWVGEGKNFAIPEIMVMALSAYSFGCGNVSGDLGARDNVSFYEAIGTLAFFIYFVLIIKCIIDQRSDPIDLLTGLSYTIILFTTFGFGSDYAIFLLWLILIIYVIIDLVKCNINYDKLVIQLTALCCIIVMYSRNDNHPGEKFGRKIYGYITMIGAYFSLLCGIALIVLYIYLLIKGSHSSGGGGSKGKQKVGGI